MILLNLLPPKYKKNLQSKRILIALKEVTMLILLFASAVAILLVGSKNILDKQLKKLVTNNQAQLEIHDKINNQVIAINKKIKNISQIQINYKKWSNFLIELTKNTSNNVQYQLLNIDRLTNTLEIRGVAQNRDDLLEFKDLLEDIGFFTEVNLPLSNLLARENNIFHIKATINKEINF